MCGYYRVTPAFIASHKSFSISEKYVFGILNSLMQKQGYCRATNREIAEEAQITERCVRKYLKKYVDYGLAFVRIDNKNPDNRRRRKIWSIETWATRKITEEVYGKEEEIQKENSMEQAFLAGGTGVPGSSSLLYNVLNTQEMQRYRESCQPAAASAKMQKEQQVRADGVILLKDYMKGKKPFPGPKDMVKKSMELLA